MFWKHFIYFIRVNRLSKVVYRIVSVFHNPNKKQVVGKKKASLNNFLLQV